MRRADRGGRAAARANVMPCGTSSCPGPKAYQAMTNNQWAVTGSYDLLATPGYRPARLAGFVAVRSVKYYV